MSASVQDTPLFVLPLELRELIYKRVLSSPTNGPEMLQTCRTIHTEAHKFLFQRPLEFHGQACLFQWIEKAPQDLLVHPKDISLEIEDVDMRPLLQPEAGDHLISTGQLLTWQLYESELDKLEHALEKLPKIRTLTLRALPGRQSFLYREFLGKFLWLMGSLYPHLQDLRLVGNFHYQDLGFLDRFSQLQSFSFDGFSSSTPTQTAALLSKLTNLTKLSLISQRAMLTPEHQVHSCFTSSRPSLTGEVVRTMHKLSSFSVEEERAVAAVGFPPQRSASTLFFTPEVFSSLHSLRTLNSLSISLSQPPNDDVLLSLEDFVDKSGIQELELDWPGLNPLVLETYALLPDCLRVFWVRATSAADAFEVLWSIIENREAGDLEGLEKIVLMRSKGVYWWDGDTREIRVADGCDHMDYYRSDSIDDMNVAHARSYLQNLGVQVFWCTESF